MFQAMNELTKAVLFRVSIIGTYLLIGAAIFEELENQVRQTLQSTRTNDIYLMILKEIGQNLSYAKADDINLLMIQLRINETILRLEDDASTITSDDAKSEWTFYSALYFSASVVTTIGYGHMAPKSFNGRLFCMFYALVGIPLNILALKSMGEFINEIIENIVTRIERKLYNRTRKHLHTKVFLCSSLLVLVTLLVGGLLYKSEGWSYFEGVYYSFIALTTIGFGDMVPRSGKRPEGSLQVFEMIIRGIYIAFGLSLVSSVLSSIVFVIEELKTAIRRWNYKANRDRPVSVISDAPSNLSQPYTLSRDLDKIVFPTVIPYRSSSFNEIAQKHHIPYDDEKWFY